MQSAEHGPHLNSRKVRSVYLITYSKTNIEIIASHESFVVVVLDFFSKILFPEAKLKLYNGCAIRNVIRMVKFTITWPLNFIKIGNGC